MMIVICDRWIDEVRGIPCELEAGHEGQCTAAVPGSMTPNPARMGLNRPRRIQLSRKKGWRKPDNTVVVARPSKWGNPERAEVVGRSLAVRLFRERLIERGLGPLNAILTVDDVRRELSGKNLACWCPLDQPCHADVLLELANIDNPLTNGGPGGDAR